MGNLERAQIRALGRCRFGRREFDKRFIRDLDSQQRGGRLRELTTQQCYTLAKIAWRYRRQLKERLPEHLIPDHEPQAHEYGVSACVDRIPDLFTGELEPPHARDVGRAES